jgi:hypothetical protein
MIADLARSPPQRSRHLESNERRQRDDSSAISRLVKFLNEIAAAAR